MTTIEEQQPIIDEISQSFVDTVGVLDNVAIILMYGSRSPKKATATPSSDAEYIAILDDPDDPEAAEHYKKINIDCVYKGIPTDIWSTSWYWLEQLANREDESVLKISSYLLGHLVYWRSEGDKQRYESLIKEMSHGEKYKELYLDRARNRYSHVLHFLGPLLLARKNQDLEYAREHIWHIIISSTILLGELNQYQYRDNWGRNMQEVFQLRLLPERWEEGINILVSSTDFDEIIDVATELLDNLRKLLIEVQEGRLVDDLEYEYIGEETHILAYMGKIQKAVVEQNIFSAAYALHDTIRAYKNDLIKQTGLWDKSSFLKLAPERREEEMNIYTQQGWPDFQSAISNRDFDQLHTMTSEMKERIKSSVSNIVQIDSSIELVNYFKQELSD